MDGWLDGFVVLMMRIKMIEMMIMMMIMRMKMVIMRMIMREGDGGNKLQLVSQHSQGS